MRRHRFLSLLLEGLLGLLRLLSLRASVLASRPPLFQPYHGATTANAAEMSAAAASDKPPR